MPDSTVAFWWSLYIMLCVLYSCILIPTRMGMGSKPSALTGFADVVLDITFLCDVYVNFKRAYIDRGTLEVGGREFSKAPQTTGGLCGAR